MSELAVKLQEKSKKLEEYVNNLDDILEIETVIDRLYDSRNKYGLQLKDNKLYICGGDKIWDWFIVDKQKKENVFKIVGLSKDGKNDLVYILGKREKEDTFLVNIENTYIENASIKNCLKSIEQGKETSFSFPVMSIGSLIGIMVAIVVGVNLLAPVTAAVEEATETINSQEAEAVIESSEMQDVENAEYVTETTEESISSGAIGSLLGILPIVFVAVMILGAVAFLGAE
jgi:hypothetical protein